MKVRALKTIYSDGATTRRHEEIPVSAVRGRQLIAKGYAVEVGDPIIPQVKEEVTNAPTEAEASSVSPFPERQSGGLTGGENVVLSSQEDRPRRKRRSTSQEDDAE